MSVDLASLLIAILARGAFVEPTARILTSRKPDEDAKTGGNRDSD